jgi:hypothetical protein
MGIDGVVTMACFCAHGVWHAAGAGNTHHVLMSPKFLLEAMGELYTEAGVIDQHQPRLESSSSSAMESPGYVDKDLAASYPPSDVIEVST